MVWLPAEGERLSPLEGRLDVIDGGPRNLPASSSTLWELMRRWLQLRVRSGVTESEVLARLQVVIDERRRSDAPVLRVYVPWFDVDTTSVWR